MLSVNSFSVIHKMCAAKMNIQSGRLPCQSLRAIHVYDSLTLQIKPAAGLSKAPTACPPGERFIKL